MTTEVTRGWIILRETQRTIPKLREYRTQARTWSANINDAAIISDHDKAWNALKTMSTNPANRFKKSNGYEILTSFKRASAARIDGEVVMEEPVETRRDHPSKHNVSYNFIYNTSRKMAHG